MGSRVITDKKKDWIAVVIVAGVISAAAALVLWAVVTAVISEPLAALTILLGMGVVWVVYWAFARVADSRVSGR